MVIVRFRQFIDSCQAGGHVTQHKYKVTKPLSDTKFVTVENYSGLKRSTQINLNILMKYERGAGLVQTFKL